MVARAIVGSVLQLLSKRRKNNPSSTGRTSGDEGPKTAAARGDAQDDLLGDDAEEPSAKSAIGGSDETDVSPHDSLVALPSASGPLRLAFSTRGNVGLLQQS